MTGGVGAAAVLDRVRVVLLLAALAATFPLVGHVVERRWLPVIAACALLLLAHRAWLVRRPDDRRARVVGWYASVPIMALSVWLSPIFGLYSFTGYIEAPSVHERVHRWWLFATTAVITALAQMGGPHSVLASPVIYGVLVTLNVAIIGLIELVERGRRRSVALLESTVTQLQAAEARNTELRGHLLAQARDAGVQDERQRLSREIHDTVAQDLVGIITQLEAAADATGADRDQRIARAQQLAREALGEARNAVRALASPRLESLPLADALAGLVADARRGTATDVELVVDGQPRPTRADGELMRVAQEALANALHHGAPHRVVVTLGYAPDGVRLDVRDDGRGFDPAVPTRGHGLAGMRERLALLGGSLDIETARGEGCTISAAIDDE